MATKTPTADELRAAILAATEAPKPDGKGRPLRARGMDAQDKLALKIARRYFALGGKHGDQIRAICEVLGVDRKHLSEADQKKIQGAEDALKRRPAATAAALFEHRLKVFGDLVRDLLSPKK